MPPAMTPASLPKAMSQASRSSGSPQCSMSQAMASGMPAISRASSTMCLPRTATPSEIARMADAPSASLALLLCLLGPRARPSGRRGSARAAPPIRGSRPGSQGLGRRLRRLRACRPGRAPAALAASQRAASNSATALTIRAREVRGRGHWTPGKRACQSAAAMRCTGRDAMAVTNLPQPALLQVPSSIAVVAGARHRAGDRGVI